MAHGKHLPPSVDIEFFDRVVWWTGLLWGQWFRNREQVRLGIGRFVNEVLGHIQGAVEGKSPLNLIIFAGHDSTIVPVLAFLGAYDDVWPVCDVVAAYSYRAVVGMTDDLVSFDSILRCNEGLR